MLSRPEASTSCASCGETLVADLAPWLSRCPACRLEASRLAEPRFNGTELVGWDADAERSLAGLRRDNARRTLDLVARHRALAGARLLDVGCAAGWFLDVARARGAVATGIEPDAGIARTGLERGLDIRVDAFPGAGLAAASFDVVTLNDVFEHLAAPADVLAAIRRVLVPGGLLVLVLPTSRGTMYRASRAARRIGFGALLDRMWQRGYESPHLFYFDGANLRRLVERHGFVLLDERTLPPIALGGLWGRIAEGGRLPAPLVAALWLALVIAYPALRLALPSDILCHVYRRDE